MRSFSPERNGITFRKSFPKLVPLEDEKLLTLAKTSSIQLGHANTVTVPRTNDRIRATVLSVKNVHLHGELYEDFLRARKHVFIDTKQWNLPETDGMEFDQYDTPQSRSIVLHEYGEILAGVRLLPTQAQCGCYSYMLRDAQLGIIDNIPQHILYERAPVAGHIW